LRGKSSRIPDFDISADQLRISIGGRRRLLLVIFPRGRWPLVAIEALALNAQREEVADARAEAVEGVSMLPPRSVRMKVCAAVRQQHWLMSR
jgi:hypothetical protein